MKKYSLAERYGMIRSRLSVMMEDARAATNIPIGERLSLPRRGFSSRDYVLYDLHNNNMDDCLSDLNMKGAKQGS